MAILLASGAAHQVHQPDAGRSRNRSQTSPERRAIYGEIARLSREGLDAQAKGDYAKAERLFKDLCVADPMQSGQFMHVYLARLYDAMGRDRDAYREYRILLTPSQREDSSSQHDPCILVRYAGLCERFGDREQAYLAYKEAGANWRSFIGPTEPAPIPRSASFNELRAAAHTSAALEYDVTDRPQEMARELDAALKADPTFWVARFYRARSLSRSGHSEEATREATVAERHAPLEGRNQIREMRRVRRLPDATGKVLPPLPAGR